MKISDYNQARIRDTNSKDFNKNGKYILYWMQSYRRLNFNHALDYSIQLAHQTGLPLVVYEGIRMNYPWASERLHKFILEGFCDNYDSAKKLGITYWPFVETPANKDKDLLFKMSEASYAIITDDFPCFIIPNHIQKVSERSSFKVIAVDGNCIAPINKYGETASAARVLRTRIHSQFPEAYINRSEAIPKLKNILNYKGKPPFEPFSCQAGDISKILKKIPFKLNIKPADN
ncbi:MAG: deoxyribodipyrimidine photolyase, partial [Spirochaetia bacterium]|nr:deoxyribodipyrimidine photolyase [Spirochaetia bacterium]